MFQAPVQERSFERGDPVARGLHYYVKDTLAPHIGLWSEATLAAALAFVRHDLRARTVWYHTWEPAKARTWSLYSSERAWIQEG